MVLACASEGGGAFGVVVGSGREACMGVVDILEVRRYRWYLVRFSGARGVVGVK